MTAETAPHTADQQWQGMQLSVGRMSAGTFFRCDTDPAHGPGNYRLDISEPDSTRGHATHICRACAEKLVGIMTALLAEETA